MKRTSTFLFLLVMVTLMITGCTTPQAPAPAATTVPTAQTPAALALVPVPDGIAGHWALSSMGIQDGTAVVYPTYPITLTVNTDGYLTGYTGCNNYFGTLNLTGTNTPDGTGMTLSGIGATKMYCAPLSNQEQEYLAILEKVLAGDSTGTELILTADSGDTLVYQRTARTPSPA